MAKPKTKPNAPQGGLEATLDRLDKHRKGFRVLVVGDLVADHYIHGRTERISREAPVLIVRHEREELRLGGAANAAWNLAALGCHVIAVGAIGADPMGGQLARLCEQSGIELHAVRSKAIHTECKTRVLAGGVNTRAQQMLRIDQGQDVAPGRADNTIDIAGRRSGSR